MEKSKILLISYYFPPDGAVGGLRMSRFAQKLPCYGFKPIVLTKMDRYCKLLDFTRLDALKDTEVVKTIKFPSMTQYYLKLKTLMFGVKGRENKRSVHRESPRKHEDNPREVNRAGLFQMLKRYILSLVILLPDEERNWVLPAAFRAVRLVRSEGIEYIMTSSPPHSVHIIGLIVKQFSRVKWVVDFRDPWVDSLDLRPDLPRCQMSDRIHSWLENKVIQNADRILTTTNPMKQALIKRYGDAPEGKFTNIPNGLDRKTIMKVARQDKYVRFTISYTGSFYAGRSPEPLFKAISSLIKEGRIKPLDISIKLVGNCQFIDGRSTRKLVEIHGLDKVVEISEAIPYGEALKVMSKSHLLLLPVPFNHYLSIPAKVYDYFGSGTKILVVADPGATSELINETGLGQWFSPRDIHGIKQYIFNCMNDDRDGSSVDDSKRFNHFDISIIIEKLAGELRCIS